MILERTIKTKLTQLLNSFPVVTLTGCRQCGKSTLLKNLLPDYTYISLEDLDIRQIAKETSFGQIDFVQEKHHLPKLRSDSFQKFAPASQTLGFVKPSSLRTDSSQPSIRDGTMIFKNLGGSAHSGQKSLIQNKQNQNYTL